jgi:hypothetical protein
VIDLSREQPLSVATAAALLQVDRAVVRKWLRDGLECVKLGCRIYTSREAVGRFARPVVPDARPSDCERSCSPAGLAASTPPATPASPAPAPPSVANAIHSFEIECGSQSPAVSAVIERQDPEASVRHNASREAQATEPVNRSKAGFDLLASKYPWDKWTDGRVWEVKEGVDFTCSVNIFRSVVYSHAYRKGLVARITARGGRVRLQFKRRAAETKEQPNRER